jgi:hypothetical protein
VRVLDDEEAETLTRRVVDRDVLVGSAIAGGFGIGWAFWAASGLSGSAAAAVRIAGVVIGAVVIAGALFRGSAAVAGRSASTSGSGSMFRSRGYLVWLAVELVALVAGNAALGATGHSNYVAAWTAFVVGVHFIGFGRLFSALFYWVGAAFLVAAVVGTAAGASVGTRQAVEASTGLIAAAALFAAAAFGLLAASGSPRRRPPGEQSGITSHEVPGSIETLRRSSSQSPNIGKG